MAVSQSIERPCMYIKQKTFSALKVTYTKADQLWTLVRDLTESMFLLLWELDLNEVFPFYKLKKLD